MSLPRILIVDDQYARDRDLRDLLIRNASLQHAETGEGHSPEKAIAIAEFCSGQTETNGVVENDYSVIRRAVEEGPWALVLLDARFDSGAVGADGEPSGREGDGAFGEQARALLARDFPGQPVVMLSSKTMQELGTRPDAYLAKEGLAARELSLSLLKHGDLTNEQAAQLLGLPNGVICESPEMLEVFLSAFQYASSEGPVLLLGNTGVGKEVVARYVHDASRRSQGPFVARNLGAIPKDLVESTLFGHVKGAFTGADKDARGLFEQADGGTLFLDEIGDMPLDAQVKLLRALQEKTITKVGSGKEVAVDVRVVSATWRDIHAAVEAGAFRADLLYRIEIATIQIPDLRNRRDDILPLARQFLAAHMSNGGKVGIVFDQAAERRLLEDEFPGNVRQLDSAIQRLVATTGNNHVVDGNEMALALEGAGMSAARRAPSVAPQATDEARSAPLLPAARESAAASAVPKDLRSLFALLEQVEVDKEDPQLKGAKPRLDHVFALLNRKLAAAALELYRHPSNGSLNRQGAVRHLMGDDEIKGRKPKQILNQVLGRPQNEALTDEQLEEMVRAVESGSPADDDH